MNQIFPPLFLLLVVSLPLLLSGIMMFASSHSAVLRLAPWAALPAFILALFTAPGTSLHLPWLLLGSELGIGDETDRLFLLFTALLWWLSGLYARVYLSNKPGQSRFIGSFLLSMTGNLGLILAQDLLSFYLFFALMSFASYGLVVHERSTEALRAGRIYIVLVVIGEIALFAAMILAATATGTTGFDTVRHGLVQVESFDLIMLLAFTGFGIKAGVLGLHVWLPLAHPVAPTPASAVLSGAMINAGLLGWLRFLPLGEISLLHWGELFMFLGLAATFYGVVVGLTQKDPKTLLAYSSISQMGILTMAVGLGLTAPAVYPAILTVITLYALHHGLNKGALFLGVGIVGTCSGAQRYRVWLTLWLPALALAGAPLTSGMAVKGLLKVQTLNAPDSWVSILQTLLPLSAVATTLLIGRFLFLLYQPKTETPECSPPAGLIWPWALLVTSSVVLPWWFVPKSPILWSQAAIFGSFWPVVLGALLTLTAVIWRTHLTRQPELMLSGKERVFTGYLIPKIPPGDLLVPISRGISQAISHGHRISDEHLPRWRDKWLGRLKRSGSSVDWWRIIARIEFGLNDWPKTLILLVLLGLIAAVLGMSE
jgi:formate hydrogenlyase subunit 3/multisubunit Na+/H+ antiporter MnhD subunit